MPKFPEEFHDKIEHYRITKQFKKRMCEFILINYHNFEKRSFQLDPIKIKRGIFAPLDQNHLNCSAITTFTLARYYNFIWDKDQRDDSKELKLQLLKRAENYGQKKLIRDANLYDYYRYVVDTFKKLTDSSNNEDHHPLDEFSFMNTLSLIKDIQQVLDEKSSNIKFKGEEITSEKLQEQIKEDNKYIAEWIIKLCDYFAEKVIKELQDKTHPYYCYIFLKIMDKWNDEIEKYIEEEKKNKKADSKINEKHQKYNFKYFFDLLYVPAKYEMYREISLSYSGDNALFDVKRLIFSLLIVCMKNRFSNSLIRKKVLQIIFDSQDSKTGLWGIGHVVTPDFIIREGKIEPESPAVPRSIPILSSIECINHMMENIFINDELDDYFRHLFITRMWLQDRRRLGDTTNQSYDDLENIIGWFPEYERDRTPKSWITSQVLLFYKNFCEKLSNIIQMEAKKDVRALEIREGKEWDNKLWDSYNFKGCMKEMIDAPLQKYRSVLLFGPPGSGKSTIAKSLSMKLKDFCYIELNPSSFLSKGTPHIVNEINEIFCRLSVIRKAVIFFDEVDQLVKNRGLKKSLSYEETLLVTSLLPKFQELYNTGNVIFILATNHIKNVDPAAIRPGRIDMVLPIGSLSEDSRRKILQEFCSKGVGEELNPSKQEEKNFIRNILYIPGPEILNLLKQITDRESKVFRNLFLEEDLLYSNKDYEDFHRDLLRSSFFKEKEAKIANYNVSFDDFKKKLYVYPEIHVPEEKNYLFSSSEIDRTIGERLDPQEHDDYIYSLLQNKEKKILEEYTI